MTDGLPSRPARTAHAERHPTHSVSAEIHEKGLKGDALTLVSSVMIGVASTAPGYSLAATLGYIVVAVGLQAPAIILIAFVPMLCTAFAYQKLNEVEPDCGTTFTWATKAFGPYVGWLGGWAMALASAVVLADLAGTSGAYLLYTFGLDSAGEGLLWPTVLGVAFIVLMTYVAVRGIDLSARTQAILVSLQVAMLLVFSVVALWKVYDGSAGAGALTPDLSWFNPFDIASASALSEGVILAAFIYWGWDSCLAINEETEDKTTTPGRAAVISTVILLGTYLLVSVSAMSFAGVGETGLGMANPENADDVISVLGAPVLGDGWLGRMLLFAIFISALSSTQTTILPAARGTLAMGTYKALPERFGTVHPRFLTPAFSTVFLAAAAIAFYVGWQIVNPNVLLDAIEALGLFIAFYYSMTGFTSAWYFRREARLGFGSLMLKIVLPLFGAIVLVAAFVKSAIDMFDADYGYSTVFGVGGAFAMGIGLLLLGVVVMLIMRVRRPAFFRGEVLTVDTPVLVDESQLVPEK